MERLTKRKRRIILPGERIDSERNIVLRAEDLPRALTSDELDYLIRLRRLELRHQMQVVAAVMAIVVLMTGVALIFAGIAQVGLFIVGLGLVQAAMKYVKYAFLEEDRNE